MANPIDPATLQRIQSMELRAKMIMEGFMHGLHRSPYHGFAVEFSEYRQYTPGDDTRHIDWKLYARSDKVFIKKYEDETNLRCQFIVDQSRSMLFQHRGGLSKANYAATLAATFSFFLMGQGDAAGVTLFDEAITDYLPARNRPGHLRQLFAMLEREPSGKGTDFGAPLQRVSEMMRQRGVIIMLTDLLAPLDELTSRLGMLAAHGHEVVVFQILDPTELDFGFEKAAQFRDLETGDEFFIDPVAAKEEYGDLMQAHIAEAKKICASIGVAFHQVTTSTPLESALSDFLAERIRMRHHAVKQQQRGAS